MKIIKFNLCGADWQGNYSRSKFIFGGSLVMLSACGSTKTDPVMMKRMNQYAVEGTDPFHSTVANAVGAVGDTSSAHSESYKVSYPPRKRQAISSFILV